MELAAQYAYKIYKKGSFSAAAQALYISQPALSAMIAKLEAELGFKIFDRTTHPLRLTDKGRIYMDMLEEIRESETNMKKRLKQFTAKPTNRLNVGTSIYLSHSVLAQTCQRFCEKYPDKYIKLNMGSKGAPNVLFEQLDLHDVDLLIGYEYSEEKHIAHPISAVRHILAARRDLPGMEKLLPLALSRSEILCGNVKEIPREQLTLFSGLPFITTDTVTAYRRRLADMLEDNYALSRVSVKNVRHMGVNYGMMRAGLGATMAVDIDLLDPLFEDENIVYFAIQSSQTDDRPLCAVWRKGEELGHEARAFLEMFSTVLRETQEEATKPSC